MRTEDDKLTAPSTAPGAGQTLKSASVSSFPWDLVDLYI